MSRLDYLDFDLSFETSGAEYIARVLNSPAGQAASRFTLPFNSLEVENLLLRIGRTRRGVRRLGSPETEITRYFGSSLFSSVFVDEVLGCLRSSLNECYRRGLGLRLRLRFSSTPELGDLPWEFLFDPSRNQFLVLSVETPMVRYLELPLDIEPLFIRPPLKVLVMIASPRDEAPLDVEREWAKLSEALGDLEQRGLVALTRLPTASLASLQRQLRRDTYHIFHFIGHGTFDSQAQDGVLLTEDESGRGRPVSGYDLGTMLHDHRSLRLAILNACEGARSSRSDPFGGVAHSLVQQGIPAVIAMQFEITDEAAITLAHEFYGALADGFPVDGALAEARKAIFAQGNDVEWGTPVLYLRAPNGVIFQIDPLQAQAAARPESPTRQARDRSVEAARLYTQGLSAFWLNEWEQAIERFDAVLELQPDHAEALTRLKAARHYLGLDKLSREAQTAETDGNWSAAIAALEQLAEQAPLYADATIRLEAARKRKQVADLYSEARQLNEAGEWQALVNIFEHLAELDPAAPDPDGLLPVARTELEAQRRQAELERLSSEAILALDAGKPEEAVRLLREVQARQPDDERTTRLLRRAEAELAKLPPAPAATDEQAVPSQPRTGSSAPASAPSLEETRGMAETSSGEQAEPAATIWPAESRTLTEPSVEQSAAPAAPGGMSSIRVLGDLTGLIRGWLAAIPEPVARPAWRLAVGWFFAGLFAALITASRIGISLIEDIHAASNYTLYEEKSAALIYLVIAGLLSGAAVWIGLRSQQLRPSRGQVVTLLSAWTVAYLLFLFFDPSGGLPPVIIFFGWLLAGAIGGTATSIVLGRHFQGFNRTAFRQTILGWTAAVVLGSWLLWVIYFFRFYPLLSESLGSEFAERMGNPAFLALFNGVIGLIGGLVMHYQIHNLAPKQNLPAAQQPEPVESLRLAEERATAEPPSIEQSTPEEQNVMNPLQDAAESTAPLWPAEQRTLAGASKPGDTPEPKILEGPSGLARSRPGATRSAFRLALGWFLAGLVAWFIPRTGLGNSLIEAIKTAANGALSWDMAFVALGLTFEGLLGGLALWTGLRFIGIRPSVGQIVALLAAWTAGFLLTLNFNPLESTVTPNLYGDLLAGALGGTATAFVLRRNVSRFDGPAFLKTVLAWAAAWALGGWLARMVFHAEIRPLLESSFGWDFTWWVAAPFFSGLCDGVAGLAGGLVMFSLLSALASKQKAPALET